MRYTLRKELRQKPTRAVSIGRLVDVKGSVTFRDLIAYIRWCMARRGHTAFPSTYHLSCTAKPGGPLTSNSCKGMLTLALLWLVGGCPPRGVLNPR